MTRYRIVKRGGQVDRRYFNACVERNNFSPVALEDVKAFFKGHDGTQNVQHSPA